MSEDGQLEYVLCREALILHCDYTISLEIVVSVSVPSSSWNASVVVGRAKAPSFFIEEFAMSSNCAATEIVDNLCEILMQQAEDPIQTLAASSNAGAIQATAGFGVMHVHKTTAHRSIPHPVVAHIIAK
mmetsp:Transcript_12964/g.23475  ORF Transcript_12964/g.23475 Transcript_12964/m.23475 type:complete len:129 (+) Transcript_12964:706-1092(+)